MKATATLDGLKATVLFPFRGHKWVTNLLVGSALSLALILPVAGIAAALFLAGYLGQIMKRVIIQDEDPILPEWTDWGGLFLDGIRIAITALIYLLPGLLFMIGGYILFMVLDLALAFTNAGMSSYSSVFPAAILGNLFGMFGGLGLVWVGLLLTLVGAVFLPPAFGNLIARGRFEAAFQFKEWWPVLRANLGGYLLAIALVLGIYSLMVVVASCLYVTVFLCILIPFAVSVGVFLLGSMAFSLFGVSYRDGRKKISSGGVG